MNYRLDLVGENTTVLFCQMKRRRADVRFMKNIKRKLHFVEIKDYPEYEQSSRENVFLYFDPLPSIMSSYSSTNMKLSMIGIKPLAKVIKAIDASTTLCSSAQN